MSLYKHLHFRGNGSLVATHIIKSLQRAMYFSSKELRTLYSEKFE